MTRASVIVKQREFKKLLVSSITVKSKEMQQNPMYPNDPTKQIPTGNDIETIIKARFIISRSSPEGYNESDAGFMPQSYRFLLSTVKMQEDSIIEYFGVKWKVGKAQDLMIFDDKYGFRTPIQVV
jgi:hypothetical protein